MRDDITLLDCGMGTTIWNKVDKKVMVWRYNFEAPDKVKEVHEECINAGSQIILANTFGANRKSFRRVKYTVEEVVARGMEIAKDAAKGRAKVALDIGPLTGLLEPFGNISIADATEYYQEQIGAGIPYQPDMIYLETFMDLEMMKVAAKVARQYDLPLFCSFSFEERGRTLMGNSVEDIVAGLKEFSPEAIGINCSFGPDKSLPIIKEYSNATDIPLIFKPNAGKPVIAEDGTETTDFDVNAFVDDVMKSLDYNVKYIGGCCQSTPEYIAALRERLQTGR